MRVTIRQIAGLAGVSRGTVDRVLNDRPKVRPEIREKVLRIAAELDYIPDLAGKSLARKKKPAVFGIIMPPADIVFFEEIRQGIAAAAAELNDFGIHLEYRYVSNSSSRQAAAELAELVRQGAAGILFCLMDDPLTRQAIDDAAARGVPVITFNSDVSASQRLCFVGQDLAGSGRIAAGLLGKITAGNARIVVVTGSLAIQAHLARVEGFAARNAELPEPMAIVQTIETFDRRQETEERLDAVLAAHRDISGIYMAAGHIGACLDVIKRRHLEKAIHVVCNDLTPEVVDGMRERIIDFTILQDPQMQGYKSLKLLFDQAFAGKSPTRDYYRTPSSIMTLESLDELAGT